MRAAALSRAAARRARAGAAAGPSYPSKKSSIISFHEVSSARSCAPRCSLCLQQPSPPTSTTRGRCSRRTSRRSSGATRPRTSRATSIRRPSCASRPRGRCSATRTSRSRRARSGRTCSSPSDLRLTPVSPGVVYGTYRYRVRYGAEEHSGLSERLFLKTPKGWRIAVTSAWEAPPGTPPPPRAYTGATLVDGTGAPAVKNAVVLVRDGKIDCAGPASACPVPAGVAATDAKGSWIVPGLVDAHVHFAQTGFGDGRPGRVRRARRASLRGNPAASCARGPSASSARTCAPASRRSSTSADTPGRSTSPPAPRTTPSRRASPRPGRSSRPSTTGSRCPASGSSSSSRTPRPRKRASPTSPPAARRP